MFNFYPSIIHESGFDRVHLIFRANSDPQSFNWYLQTYFEFLWTKQRYEWVCRKLPSRELLTLIKIFHTNQKEKIKLKVFTIINMICFFLPHVGIEQGPS